MARRIALFAWALLFMMFGALAEEARAYVIQAAGVTALVSETGESILEGDGIDEIFAVRPGGLYAAGTRGDYALYDVGGNPQGTARFAMIDDAGDALIFRQGKFYGAMDEGGGIILPAEWSQLVSNGEGGFIGLLDGAAYRIDAQGTATPLEVIIKEGLTAFHDGRMVFIQDNGRYGCLDAAGNVVIDSGFAWIGDFRDGFAIAVADSRYGLIDTHGHWVVKPGYSWMGRGESFIAALTENGGLCVFSNAGELRYEVRAQAIQGSVVGEYAALWDVHAVRLYNLKGRCIYEAAPDILLFPGMDGQVIASAGQWDAPSQWLVNPSGIAGEGRYQRIAPLLSGRYAFLTMQGVEYYSEILDSLQISWNYDSARWGLMDGAGAALLPAEYLEIRPLGTDRLLLRRADAVLFADRDGEPLRAWAVTPTRTSSAAGG